ncbi:hypothetical protein [Methyloglobulus sp.]
MTATLDVNTLRQRAAAFAKEFSKSTYEMGEAQDFVMVNINRTLF